MEIYAVFLKLSLPTKISIFILHPHLLSSATKGSRHRLCCALWCLGLRGSPSDSCGSPGFIASPLNQMHACDSLHGILWVQLDTGTAVQFIPGSETDIGLLTSGQKKKKFSCSWGWMESLLNPSRQHPGQQLRQRKGKVQSESIHRACVPTVCWGCCRGQIDRAIPLQGSGESRCWTSNNRVGCDDLRSGSTVLREAQRGCDWLTQGQTASLANWSLNWNALIPFPCAMKPLKVWR